MGPRILNEPIGPVKQPYSATACVTRQ